jgi:hypothetical protein
MQHEERWQSSKKAVRIATRTLRDASYLRRLEFELDAIVGRESTDNRRARRQVAAEA